MQMYMMFVLALVAVFSQSTFAVSLLKADDGKILECASAEDYAVAKTGAYRITSGRISLRQQKELVVTSNIDAARCVKVGAQTYRWEMINPNNNVTYEHEYFDFKANKFKSHAVTLEHKAVWMSAINDGFRKLGKGDVVGSLKNGFRSSIVIPLAKVFDAGELQKIKSGGAQKTRVGIFLKSLTRHTSLTDTTDYEELGNSGLYYISVTVQGTNGQLSIK